MIGFELINLLIPGEPQSLQINTPGGTWNIDKAASYARNVAGIPNGKCGETYTIVHPVSQDQDASVCDAVFQEMTPLVLGASYLTGLTVTSRSSVPHSDVMLMQHGDHWPRERAMGPGNPIINNTEEFTDTLQRFVGAWSNAGQTEKALLLVHHWLDSLSSWSFESLYINATTLLEIIVATEGDIQRRKNFKYFHAVTAASKRAGIEVLSGDFKDIRNELIHRGTLVGGKFAGKTHDDCAEVAADVLNWFDKYLHSVLGLGSVRRQRFGWSDFMGFNAYSI